MKLSAGGTIDQANVLQFAVFYDHGWGTGYDISLACIIKLFQPSHNCASRTAKKLSEILWRAIRALIYDLHQLIQNFKSPALLSRFACGIADYVPLVLKPLAQGPIRKV